MKVFVSHFVNLLKLQWCFDVQDNDISMMKKVVCEICIGKVQ
jgi:hypothetical protein